MKHYFHCRICGCEGWSTDRTPVDLQILRSEICTDCLKIVYSVDCIFDENEDLGILAIPSNMPKPEDSVFEQLDIPGAISTLADVMGSDLVPEDDEDAQYLDVLTPLQSHDLSERFAADLFNPDAYLNLDAALTRAYYAGVVSALRYIKNMLN